MSDFRAIREEIEDLMDLLEGNEEELDEGEDELDEDEDLEEARRRRVRVGARRVKRGGFTKQIGGRFKMVTVKRQSAQERAAGRKTSVRRGAKQRRRKRARLGLEHREIARRIGGLLEALQEATGYEFGIENGELFYYDE